MKQYVEVWKIGEAGGYNLVNDKNMLKLSGGEPFDYAVWHGAQLAICLDFIFIVDGQIVDPFTIKAPKYTHNKEVKKQ